MPSLMPTGKQQYFYTGTSKPLANGKVYTYAAGTSTPKTTWQDAAGTVPNTNPIVLDSTGSALIFWSGSYKVVLVDSSGNTIYTVDNYNTDQTAALQASIAQTSGASLVGFTQSGTGAVARTVQDKARDIVNVKDFGAIGDGITDDYPAFVKARDYCLSTSPYKRMAVPAGRYKLSQTFSIDYPGLVIRGDGKLASVLYYTGTGVAVQFTNAHPNNGVYSFGGHISDIGIEGNANSTALLLVNNVHHFVADHINLKESSTTNGIGLQVLGTVCGQFRDIVCSTNQQPMTNRPQNGIVVSDAIVSGVSNRATGNKFDGPIIEGTTGDGIQIINADGCVIVGGTSENNSGNSVTITTGRMNTIIGMSLEKGSPAGFANIYDNGYANKFIGCYTNQLVYVDTNALFHELVGGYHQSIEIHGDFATVHELKFSFFAAGGTYTPAANTSSRNIFNANTSALVFQTKATAVVSVTASPFTYTNGSGLDEQVIISGGTVTQVVFNRGGPVTTLPTAGMYRLAPQDQLVISYTAAPTVVRVPFGSNYI